MDLLTTALYKKVLIEPMVEDSSLDRLLVVSGYSAAGMGVHHASDMLKLRDGKPAPKIDLLCGMTAESGIGKEAHAGFVDLCAKRDLGFSCRYLVKGEPVHAKVYVWCAGKKPVVAYTGSANYSQNAFRASNTRREVLTPCSASMAYDFYQSLLSDSANCCDATAVKGVVGKGRVWNVKGRSDIGIVKMVHDPSSPWNGMLSLKSSLLMEGGANKGAIHTRAGLNWGQRKGREPNQAYIPVNSEAQKSGFFPEIGDYFTVTTDDGKVFQCVRAQQNGKAIETYGDNSELGRYFRQRLGLSDGAYVNAADLKRYGRTDVTFYKIDDENFILDFSK